MRRLDMGLDTIGQAFEGAACVATRTEKRTKGDKPFLVVTVRNATGSRELKVWSERMAPWRQVAVGDGVHLTGSVVEGFRGGTDLEVARVAKLPPDHWIRAEMNPVSDVPEHVLRERFARLRGTLGRTDLLMVLDAVLDDVGFDAFFRAPAASHNHHNYVHGLVRHTLEVAEGADALLGVLHFPGVDRDVLLTGALLHDVGKVEGYDFDGVPIQRSRLDYLQSHITRGLAIVGRVTAELVARGAMSEHDAIHLCHLIESHHGTNEWGSPSTPRTPEAIVLHLADMASSRMDPVRTLAKDPEADGWSDGGYRIGPIWLPGLARAGGTAEPPRPRMPARSVIVTDDLLKYLHYLVTSDLRRWNPDRRCRLDRHAAELFAEHLQSMLRMAARTGRQVEEAA